MSIKQFLLDNFERIFLLIGGAIAYIAGYKTKKKDSSIQTQISQTDIVEKNLQIYQTMLDDVEQRYIKTIDSLEEKYRKDMENIRKEHEIAIKKIKEEHIIEITRIKDMFKDC